MEKTRGKCLFIALLLYLILATVFVGKIIPQGKNVALASNNEEISISVPVTKNPLFAYSSGDGTSSNPYIISSAQDMYTLSSEVASGNLHSGKYFKVADGISNISLTSFTPIGNQNNPFSGNFNGNGANFNLSIDSAGDYVALFGRIAGNIENVSTSGTLKGRNYVAGIVGYQYSGTVKNVYNTASITATGTYSGGVVGYINTGTISYFYNTGAILGNGHVGGLVGYTNGSSSSYFSSLSYGYNAGTVAGGSNVGAILGNHPGSATSGNGRTYLYYDIATNANYIQPSGYIKPTQGVGNIANGGTVLGLDRGVMVASMEGRGFAETSWQYDSPSGSYSYYPQLNVFSKNSKLNVLDNSKQSVKIFTGDGLGTNAKPFLLRNLTYINNLKTLINKGNTLAGFYYKMQLDGGADSINLGNFEPIGNTTTPFYGNFDGNNVEFVINRDSALDYQGLFGVYYAGTIKNLSVSGFVKGGNFVGGIVGRMYSGNIQDVYNLAEITGTGNYSSGIVGYMDAGTVQRVYNAGKVTGGAYVGGIVGHLNTGTVNLIYNTGAILGGNHTGGLIGYTNGSTNSKYSTVSNGYNKGTVASTSKDYVGGVIGYGAGYTTSGNVRNNLYYDLSVIVNFSPPAGRYKPTLAFGAYQDVTYCRGLNGEVMLEDGLTVHRFTASDWTFLDTASGTAYYPQLNGFSSSANSRIALASKTYTKVDVSGGLGTANFPFLITSTFDMNELSRRVTEGNTFSGFYFKVADGIDNITLGAFTPIGNGSFAFAGSFNGNGANFDLAIDSAGDYVGLFGNLTGLVENVSTSGTVKGRSYVAGIVGYQYSGTVRNVYNLASIRSTGSHSGGVVGFIHTGTISYVYNMGAIWGTNYVGGLVGYTNGSTNSYYNTISYGYNAGTVAGSGYIGGVLGHNAGYPTSGNSRSYLYYDLASIANYIQPSGFSKPTQAVGNIGNGGNILGLDSGHLLTNMANYGFTSNWKLEPKDTTYAYYPQLLIFADSETSKIVAASKKSVKVFVGDGMGTSAFPFLLRNEEDLNDLKVKIKSGNTFAGFYFKMELDENADSIDLGDFEAIGNATNPFYGSFDGSNVEFVLNINKTSDYQGLFGVYYAGTIKNLSVSGSVKGGSFVGGIVGRMYSGSIQDVYNLADIYGTTNYTSGIVGYMDAGTVQRAYNAGKVTGGTYVGGIVGHLNTGTVNLIYNTGAILGGNHTGGLIGYTNGSTNSQYNNVSNGYNKGTVASTSKDYVGGVIGYGAGYTTSGNVRNNLYYDLSVIVNFSPPAGRYKPTLAFGAYQDVTYCRGLNGEVMLEDGLTGHRLNAANWVFLDTNDGMAYYPQLIGFANSANSRIAAASIKYISVDVSGGLGTSKYPFLITSAFDMNELSRRVTEGNTFSGFYFKVADSVDNISLGAFTPIGNGSFAFAGSFNGNGANFDLAIDSAGDYVGLFGNLTGLVENVSTSGTVKGRSYVAGIVGYQYSGTVRNVYNLASIRSTGSHSGGIVGFIHTGTISYVYNMGAIWGTNYVGGLVGYTNGSTNSYYNSISYGYNAGTVAGSGYIGGVLGHNAGYPTSGNSRSYLYYDLASIANYIQPSGFSKPTQAVGNIANGGNVLGLDSGHLLTNMASYGFSTSNWTMDPVVDKYAYYPQLIAFTNNANDSIKAFSKESVKIFVGDGLGTSSLPFLLRNEEDLNDLKIKIKSGNTFQGFFFKMELDNGIDTINLGNFEPIGVSGTYPFYGSFDGSNTEFVFEINSPTTNYIGLFGYFGIGTIKNLSIKGSIVGYGYTGGVVGYMASGTVQNVYNIADITGNSNYTSGIVGYVNSGLVENAFNAGTILGKAAYVGGIVGMINTGTVRRTYNTAAILGGDHTGGLVGYANGSTNSYYNTVLAGYNKGTVASTSGTYLGGIVGYGAGYPTSGNVKNYLYYDLSVMVNFSPPSGRYKPKLAYGAYQDVAYVKGLNSEKMLANGLTAFYFDSSVWAFLDTTEDTAYYPQLDVFANSDNERIRAASLEYVTVDVSGGLGTSAFPFLITSAFDMDELSRRVAEGNTFSGFYFKVADGIESISLDNFKPIGNSSYAFAGSFNGNGTNFDLAIDSAGDYVGLFGNLTGLVENVSTSGTVKGRSYVAGIVAYQYSGTVRNVYNTASIRSTGSHSGGIVGFIHTGTINNVYNMGAIWGTNYVGGLVGYTNGSTNSYYNTISYGYNAGTVAGSGYMGGVLGQNAGYPTSGNSRSYLYYDLASIANFIQPSGFSKPTQAVGNVANGGNVLGLDSGQLLTNMINYGFSTSNWTMDPKDDEYAYYPQLNSFAKNETESIVLASRESVKIFVKNGLGTSTFPFILRNEADIEELKIKVKSGNTFQGFFFKMELDDNKESINLGNFEPIGISNALPFNGSFDGNNVEFVINIDTTNAYQGLFGHFGVGTIKNLSVSGSVKGGNYTAGVVGIMNSGNISDVYNLATVNGGTYVGGIVGYMGNGTLQKSFNAGEIKGTGTQIGGVIGGVGYGTISYIYNTGNILGGNHTGGLIGYTSGSTNSRYSTVSYGYNAGTVASSGGTTYVGGVIGYGAGYPTSGNLRQYLYYDLSVMESYKPPSGYYKPLLAFGLTSNTASVKSLTKTAMIASGMESNNFSNSMWTFRNNEGRWAYYPQLKNFASSSSERIVNESMLYVRTVPFSGQGTEDSPYILYTVSDLMVVANSINQEYDALNTYYIVSSTVSQFDLSKVAFTGIGSENNPFNGHLDGNFANFILNIDSSANCVGLFGYLGINGSAKNISVTGSVKGGSYVGGIAGLLRGEVSYVYNTATISGVSYLGGIAGSNVGKINIGYNRGNISASGGYAGGIAGYNSGTVSQVYSGSLVSGANAVGGVLGYSVGEDVANAYYDSTLIRYYTPQSGQKPARAIGNIDDITTIAGKENEEIRGISLIAVDKINFDPTLWVEKASTGMYDYYLQLRAFASNINSIVSSNSEKSARVIRFEIGSGIESDPYIIRNKEDMKLLSDIGFEDSVVGLYFKVQDGVLTIDLSEESLLFRPIGSTAYNFRGNFDGNGAEFTVNIQAAANAGLFGILGEGAYIKNLSVAGLVKGTTNIGGIAGSVNKAIIENVSNKAQITGTSNNIGGIAGYVNTSQILYSYNLASVSASTSNIGGIAGYTTLSSIKYVYNFGVISGANYVGGITGRSENKSNIFYCYNTNNVIATGNYVGGLIGYLANSYLDNGYSAGAIRGGNQAYLGGLVGRGDTSAESNSYYDKTIIDADLYPPQNKPIRAVANKLDTSNLRASEKAYLTGDNIISEEESSTLLNLDPEVWTLKKNNGIDAFYPQLKYFAQSDNNTQKAHSLSSVRSYIFAGKGEELAPYIIINEVDMIKLAELVALGNSFTGLYFNVRETAQEFDFTYYEYYPIGNADKEFNGFFNGNGVNFLLNMSESDYTGLFGRLGENAVAYNFSVSGNVTGANNVGSVVGYNKGEVHTVYSTAKVRGTNYVGGLIGNNLGKVYDTYYVGEVVASSGYVGGLIGYNYLGEVRESFVAAKVSGLTNIGGIIGYQSGTANLSNLFYNKTITEIHAILENLKPTKAVSNVDDSQSVTGKLVGHMTSGSLGIEASKMNLNADNFLPLAPFGFDIYYPQLKYFASNSGDKVKLNSKNSVTVNRFNEGDGSEEDPYIIRTAMDMKAISDLVTTSKSLEGKFFKVANGVKTIDMTEEGFVYFPIGYESCYFQGNFDGNGATFIMNLSGGSYYRGLFGFVGNKAVIKNVAVNGQISGVRFVAGIAGRNRGLIENCYNLATVTASEYYAGGIVGYNEGTVRNCYNVGAINTVSYYYVGGIVGYTARNTLVEYCYNRGTISSNSHYVGGIAGYSQGKISNTYSAGIINGLSAGGVIGAQDGYATTFYSYYDLTVIAFSEVTRKPVRAISNIANSEFIKGVATSQICGDNLFGVTFEEDLFLLKPNDGFVGYYPQLKAFVQSGLGHIRSASVESVSTKIFVGEGTEDSPYFILSETDMRALTVLLKQGIETENIHFKVYYSKTIFDLSSDELGFYPIGNSVNAFKGIFEGNNAEFIIDINTPSNYTGLFGYLESAAKVSNFTLSGSVTGGEFTGSVAGYNSGSIFNVGSTVNVVGLGRTGGIIGVNEGRIDNCYFKGLLIASGDYAGGITAENSGIIIYSYNFAKINGTQSYVGGLVGNNKATGEITNSFNHGDVSSEKQYAGGIAATNSGKIELVYNTSNVSAKLRYAGGLTALNSGTIDSGFQAGKVMSLANAGGVSSTNTGSINNAYYNTSDTDRMLPDATYMRVTSAIFNMPDTENVKGLTLDLITGLDAIGSDGMNLDVQLWALKQGFDFLSYYPEMLYFRNHENIIVREDSLISITDKKFEGEGTVASPYLIYDGYDMRTIDEYVVKGNLFGGKYFRVADEINIIDLSFYGLFYNPIGNDEMKFGGILDGRGANFIIDLDNEDLDYQGIFHTLGSTANVYNLSVSGQVIGKSYVGSVAGRSLGIIDNVKSTAIIKSFDGNNVGGITGFNEGTVKNSHNLGNVTMRGTYGGGLVGENIGTVSDSYNKGVINGITNIGGIAGRNFNTILRCYNAGIIISQTQAGGIAGENDYIISQSFNMGNVKATIAIAGGISGAQRTRGDGTTPTMNIVYNTGEVYAYSNLSGGIIGHMLIGTLHDAYNGGNVSAATETGAILGFKEGGSISRSYYDKNRLENYTPSAGLKPIRAISNAVDSDTVKGLYRGQMAGAYSIGTKLGQMNFIYPASFVTTPSYEKWSFYPQIKVFATSASEQVKTDSLESVRGLTFIVGSGLEYDPYIISNESDIIALAETVNSGNEYNDVYFEVATGVTEFNFYGDDGYIFTPIGTKNASFNGKFNANGVNFKIKLSQNADYIALFGHVGVGGVIRNLSVSGEITGNNYTAGIASINKGIISNVYNMAKITGKDYTAGIVALNNEQILNVYNRGEIIGYNYVGGISGYMDGFITNSYNTGVVYGRENIGTIAGFLNTGLVLHSYYDTQILGAYRSVGTILVKPERGVSNSVDSETVKGLSKNFMIGVNALGAGEYQMYFAETSNNWGTTYNIDGMENYPQLRVFSRSVYSEIKNLSKESTLTTLFIITYDYNDATENNHVISSQVLYNKHYVLEVPYKYGFNFVGWYYVDPSFEYIKYTDENGLSLKPYDFENNIQLVAQYEVAYHDVNFTDGDNKIVYTVSIRHGYTVTPPENIVPEKSRSATLVYLFDKWDFDFENRIEKTTTIYGKYTELDRYYRLTFLDGNKNFFDEVKVEYGFTANQPKGTPVKEYVGDTAYKFASWDFDFETVIYENYLINSLFSEVDRWYTVSFVNYDMTLVSEQTVEYLMMAFAPATPPAKPSTVDTVYVFTGWDQPFTKVETNLTIVAQFVEEERLYEIIFLDGNAKRFDTQYIPYEGSAITPEGRPRKDFVDNIAYKFTGWDKDFSYIVEDMQIAAKFDQVNRYYEVVFANYDGAEISKQTVEYLASAIAPNVIPERESDAQYDYTFSGWDKEFEEVEEAMTIYAMYTGAVRFYDVVFIDGNGIIFDSQYVEYSLSALEPFGTPRKDAHDQFAYKFIGWNKDYSSVVSDMTIYALFEEIDRYYDVIFVNYDGTHIETFEVEYFSASPQPENVEREPTDMYIYNFASWDKDISCITESITVTAVYEEALRPFSVKFIDGDGKVYSEQSVLYGSNAMIPEGTPTKLPDDNYAYRFSSWIGNLNNITEDTEITSTYTSIQRYYFVTFYGYDTTLILKSERVEYGTCANPPQPPVPTHANIAYEYYFTGWDKNFDNVQSDLVVTAKYASRMKSFTVTFINGDETIEQKVNYGANAIAPTPVKTGNHRVTYTFVKWDKPFTSIQADLVVTAIFEPTYHIFVVTFINGNGSVLEEVEVGKGGTAVPTLSPFKASTENKVYIFTEWDRSLEDVQQDMTVKSLFAEKDRYYSVVFKDAHGNDFTNQTVEYGQTAIEPDYLPIKDSTDKYDFIFESWDTNFDFVTQNLTISPVYTQELRTYIVNFIDGDDKIVSTQEIVYGNGAIQPETATKTASGNIYYLFAGWSTSTLSITRHTDVYAIFNEVQRWYEVVFVGENDKVLDSQTIEYGSDAKDPIRELQHQIIDDNYIMAITGWDKTFTNIKADLTVNAIYNKVNRWYTVRFYNEDNTLLKQQTIEYGKSATAPSEPTKEGTEDYIYEFAGWSGEFDYITANTDIYATYLTLENKLTVIFYDGDGNIFDQQIVFYGYNANMPDGIPTKTPTDSNSYKFIGWDNDLQNVTKDRKIYAKFEEIIRQYTVRFVNLSNALIKEQQVPYGEDATPPMVNAPAPDEKYTYEVEWTPSYINITKDTVIKLSYKACIREYTYTFLDYEGKIIKSVVAPYGTEITPPANPQRPMTEKYVFTFECWTPQVDATLTKDVIFSPHYEETIRQYTVTFLDGDGKIFDEQKVAYGSNGKVPEDNPTKSPTQQYYYQFKMWEAYPNSIRTDTVIRSVFTSHLQLYTVTFIDENNNVLKKHSVPYGTGATEPTSDLIPKKASTPVYIYTFVGWSRPFSNITEDITVKTVYIGIIRSYTYTFYDDDRLTIIKQVKGIYGSNIVAPPNPKKESNEEEQYVFIGWDKVVADTLVEDIDYYAVYKVTPKTFNVVFYDGDSFVISVQTVNYGNAAATPEKIPTKTSNVMYQYEFEKWIEDYSVVTCDLKVYPSFIQKLREYKVTVVDYDGSTLDVYVEYGKSAEEKLTTPIRKGYRFMDWDRDITSIKSDTYVYPIYKANNYQINFHPQNADTGYMSPIIAPYDSIVALPAGDYTRKGYYFTGWEATDTQGQKVYYHDAESIKFQQEGLNLYAMWLPIIYNISYELDGGEAINPSSYTIEDHIVLQDPIKKDYKFKAWYAGSIPIQGLRMAAGLFSFEEPSLPEGEQITEIPEGTMGNIVLYATYTFDGYITLKEGSELSLITANGLVTTEVTERTQYSEENPVYIKGVSLGYTAADLKYNFVNEGLVVLNAAGNQVADSAKIGTGSCIVIYDESGEIRDLLTVVIMGDINGDCNINNVDANMIKTLTTGATELTGAYLLAADIDNNTVINNVDYNTLKNSINK